MTGRSLGVFDSGFGGLSILKAIRDLLPEVDIDYLGDTARYPYGPKPLHEVRRYSTEISRFLAGELDAQLVVVACNTASSAGLDGLLHDASIPVIGTIEAGVRAASAVSVSRRVGVIGTIGTIASGSYQESFQMQPNAPELACQACPGLVEFVEKGETDSEEIDILLRALLDSIVEAKVDTLLLGCTHYPFLSRAISSVVGPDVVLVSSAEETAFEVLRRIQTEQTLWSGTGRTRFFTTGDPAEFQRIGSTLLGVKIPVVNAVSVGYLEDLYDE